MLLFHFLLGDSHHSEKKSSRFYIFRSVFSFANKTSRLQIKYHIISETNYLLQKITFDILHGAYLYAFTCYALNKFIVTQIQTHTYSFTKGRFGLQSIYNIFPLLDKSFMYIIDYAHI